MDTVKSAIKSFVLDLRKTLEAEIEVGLRRYGISAGKWRDVGELKHLDDRGIADRIRMEEAIRHEMRRAGDKSGEAARAEAVRWFIREIAFTHLNRLVALKVLEVRGLIPEIIQPRPEYGNRSRAHRDYREAHPADATAPEDALEAAIKSVCRRVYPEFRILFDVGDHAGGREPPANSVLWPSYPALKTCIAKINALDAEAGHPGPSAHRPATPEESVWAEDEIIGWIYQFYNAEEKKAIRERGKPKHPAEVAIINQFFTPRWIVKFLVDNTLGRLWLEMHPDSPRVRAKCDYLVPEPLPADNQQSPISNLQSPISNPQSPINNPSAPARRPPKRPQDLRLIDPACGTMHFGHYAFEVFQAIYADAREQGWVSGDDALSDDDVPAAILRHNLYGVDIDLRAVQLAALSLFIKAKTANPQAKIDRVNLVVADAYLPDGKVREEFLKQYAGEPVIQRAFREVFESLNNVAEVGSLLRVEARFRQILEAADHPAANGGNGKKKSNGGAVQRGFAEITPGWSAEHTIEQMLNHLREFARRALQEHDLNAQLFAAETEKSVALLDVLLHEYDALVMNPPYGQALDWEDIANADEANRNLYSAFVLRASTLVGTLGYVGALTDRTFLSLNSFDKFRAYILQVMPPLVGVDLGWDVLDDANVATCAFVYSLHKDHNFSTFFRVLDVAEKRTCFEQLLNRLFSGEVPKRVFVVNVHDFSRVPTHPFCYWTPKGIIEAFTNHRLLEPAFAVVRKGLSPGDSPRFTRMYWEVLSSTRHFEYWANYANGGQYSPYYRDNPTVVLWRNNGETVKAIKPKSVVRSEKLYGKSGATYGKRHHLLNVQWLEEGHVFSNEGYLILPKRKDDLPRLIALLNSDLIRCHFA